MIVFAGAVPNLSHIASVNVGCDLPEKILTPRMVDDKAVDSLTVFALVSIVAVDKLNFGQGPGTSGQGDHAQVQLRG